LTNFIEKTPALIQVVHELCLNSIFIQIVDTNIFFSKKFLVRQVWLRSRLTWIMI